MKKILIRLALYSVAILFTTTFVAAGTSFAHTCYWVGGASDVLWSTPANWSSSDGGSGSTCLGTGGIADTNDTANFTSADVDNVTADVSGTGTINMQSGYTGVITIDPGVATFTVGGSVTQTGGTFNAGTSDLTVLGTVTQTGGIFNAATANLDSNNITVTSGTFSAPGSGKTMTVSSVLTVSGTGVFTHNNGTVVFDGSVGEIDVVSPETLKNMEIDQLGTSGLIITNPVNITGTLTLTGGRLTGLGTLTASGGLSWGPLFTGGNNGILIVETTSDVTMNGASCPSSLTINTLQTFTTNGTTTCSNVTLESGTFTHADGYDLTINTFTQSGGTFNAGTGSVTHANATISGDASTTAYNADTASVTITSALNITNSIDPADTTVDFSTANLDSSYITVTSGTFLAPGSGKSMTISNNLVVVSPSIFTHNEGTVVFDGSSGEINVAFPATFKNMEINQTGLLVIYEPLDIDGDFIITSGTVNMFTNALVIAGDFLNSGTLQSNSVGESVTLDGTNQTIGGTTSTTFYDLIKSVTAADTLTFASGTTTTITNTTVLTGTDGNQLTLNSTTPGSQWSINAAVAGRTINYVSVQDSNNTSGTVIDLTDGGAGEYGIDLLNNLNWILSAAPPVPEFTTWLYVLGLALSLGYFYKKGLHKPVRL